MNFGKLGFGFLRLPKAEDGLDWDSICAMVDAFLSGGGKLFDTCYTYLDGLSEEAIRRCVAQRYPRDCFQLSEKLPGLDCGFCGAPNCHSFADDVIRGYAKKSDCVVLMRRKLDKIKSELE